MKSIARILTCALSLLIISAVRQEAADARLMRSRVAYTKSSVSFAQRFAESGRLHMKPASLAFGRVKVGATSKSLPLTLSNIGGAPLKIGSISTASNQFKIANQCASELAGGGDTCQVMVAFAPTSDKRDKATHVHAILDITETSGRVHKVLLSGTALGPDDPATPTPMPSSQATPDPLVHAILVTNSACNTVTEYPIGAAGNAAPTFPQTGLCNPTGIAVDSNKNVYITNRGHNDEVISSVTEYAAGSNGDAPPISTIVGPHTGLDLPTGLAVLNEKIYVTNDGSDNGDSDSITVYAAGSTGDAAPIATISGSKTRLDSPAGVAVDNNGNIYVVNPGNNTVSIYSAGSNGNVAPSAIISGFDTGLDSPVSVALDANANIYVGNIASLTEYAAGSNGDAIPVGNISNKALGIAVDGSGKVYTSNGSAVDVYTPMDNGQFTHSSHFGVFNPIGIALDASENIYALEPNQDFIDFNKVDAFQVLGAGSGIPIATVTSPNTEQVQPIGIALDSSGNIYIGNPTGSVDQSDFLTGTINVYPAGSGATVSPSATIVGDYESQPSGIALDATGRVYVTSNSLTSQFFGASDEVTIYSPLGQNLSLIATIEGDKTQLSSSTGIALDTNENIYVANLPDGISIGGDSINVYSAESSGNVAPIAVISGSATGLAFPSGVAVDSIGNIYATNKANDSITVYAAGSNGNVAPMATISGSNTGLDTPSAIALDSSGIIYVTNEGGFDGNNASVTVYPAGSNGNVSPGLTIGGSATQLARPQGIAVLP